jgi:hypothetical protein
VRLVIAVVFSAALPTLIRQPSIVDYDGYYHINGSIDSRTGTQTHSPGEVTILDEAHYTDHLSYHAFDTVHSSAT